MPIQVQIETIILDLCDVAQDMTRSDLQGIVEVEARKIMGMMT